MFKKHLWKSGILSKDAGHRFAQVDRFAEITHLAITCSNLTIETLEQGVKHVQS